VAKDPNGTEVGSSDRWHSRRRTIDVFHGKGFSNSASGLLVHGTVVEWIHSGISQSQRFFRVLSQSP
jgi:hypothetical protein